MKKNTIFKTFNGLYDLTSLQAQETLMILVENYGIPVSSVCFAENIIAEQFIEAQDGSILQINLESGEIEFICKSMKNFRFAIMEGDDANYFSLNTLRDAWMLNNRQCLENDARLLSIIPFVAGGLFEAENLYSVERGQAIAYLIDFYKQTKDLPDGAVFEFQITP